MPHYAEIQNVTSLDYTYSSRVCLSTQ